ncbi:signal peptidase I [Sphaerochaeta pleomorpha str. Grapes]|uniref:Signal peptidase I n=1 Tax=Sphaerochaeta pleomorpha (strain ATCC BAA-1885 / DSM 22778 / Grapes) TaxID=158190 RepID=G8QW10_SPHPG|nr:signal peptidase I [Sphaerochaeta pleomorpha]AEV28253.1 signal peptidase I [Sphaerochaeta pleomorpha str. Grapes]
MDKIWTFLEKKTVSILTRRKAEKAYELANKKPRTVVGEIKGWADALVFAVVAVFLINQYLFQLFLIPTPSMVNTLLVRDRVFVSKTSYGIEIYPSGPKIAQANRMVHRDNIITFYNPEYISKGPFFDILSQILYMSTFSLVNIDRNEDGSIAERLYVKRAIGFPGDVIRFQEGNVYIRPSGSDSFIDENTFRAENNLVDGPHRSVDASTYDGIKAWGSLFGYKELGIQANSAPTYLSSAYLSVKNDNYPDDMYQFETSKMRTKALFDPSDFNSRSDSHKYSQGIYVPQGSILPLGDNRDDSRDGRYFGPISQKKINGRVLFRFFPFNRIGYLGNK